MLLVVSFISFFLFCHRTGQCIVPAIKLKGLVYTIHQYLTFIFWGVWKSRNPESGTGAGNGTGTGTRT